LYSPELRCPIEAAGTGLKPLVRLKLSVDTRGKVTRAEVTSIEPSSELDDAFRAAAQGGLSAWRFAPGEKDGAPVPSEITVAVQFVPPDESIAPVPGTPASTTAATSDASFESLRYDYRARVLAMSLGRRRAIADAIAAQAEDFVKKDKRVVARDDWFEVVTDFGGQKQAEALLQNVEATFAAIHKVFGTRVPPRPREDRLRVYVFETKAQYDQFAAKNIPFEWSAGFYAPAGVLAFHTQHPTVGFLRSVLFHETTHAYVDRHLTKRGTLLPRWLDEGFAEYIGNSDVKDGQLLLGLHKQRKESMPVGFATIFWQSASRSASETAQRAQRQKRALTLSQIVGSGVETFYGKDYDLYYAQGWLAVHFLRHGRPGWMEDVFPRFLLYVAEGYAPVDAMRVCYGATPEALEAEYQRYVKTF
jgi:TonB family protein